MAVERIITPAPYVYGKTNTDKKVIATITYVNIAGFKCERVFEDVTRYYVGKNGNTLTLHVKGKKEKAVRLEWDRLGRIWVSGNGASEVVRSLSAVITEDGITVVAA